LALSEHFLALPKVKRIQPILLNMLKKNQFFPQMEEKKLGNFPTGHSIFFYSKLKLFALLVEELTPVFNVYGP